MYAIICFDRPDSARLRDANRAAHVQFLNTNASRIAFGGPLKGSADGPSTGALIVARAQYRGQGVKRRMVHARAPAGVALQPGQEFNGGTVVDVAPAEGGAELLAVMPV